MMGLSVVLGLLCSLQDPQPKEPLTLTVAADKAEATLGEEIQLEVKLENTGDKDARIPELAFEKRSVSFEITIPGAAGKPPRTFQYSITRGDPHIAQRLPLPETVLAKGKAVVGLFRLPTLQPGDMDVVVKFAAPEKELRTAPVKVKVSASGSGSKLAAIVDTEKGKIQFDLLPEEAPANVINFILLARAGFYNGMLFHRVIRSSWVQTGCPYGIGIGGPGYAIASEAKEQENVHELGSVSMCGFEKSDWNGSQFFMCLGKIPALDRKFTVIGKISDQDSLKVLGELGRTGTNGKTDRPEVDLVLKSVGIVVK